MSVFALLVVLTLIPLISCKVGEAGTEITSSEIREVAETSRKLAVELSLILERVRAGLGEAGSEEMIGQLNNKIEILEKQLGVATVSDQEQRDNAKNRRSHKFRQMLTQFYLGNHYDFSL